MGSLRHLFLLHPDIAFLNFGSFGACPRMIFDRYQKLQRELEEEPVQFFQVNGPGYLRKSRQALGSYLNAHENDLVYVTNPSYAVNIVARSLRLQPGDEILTTNLEYGACERTWSFCCKKAGAVLRRQNISLPLSSQEKFLDDFFAGVSPKTKMIFLSHITSVTALILPVKAVCEKARALGIPCFVDGAHAPGQLDLDLTALDADFYTGACHKWMMAPKGSAFLHVKKSHQNQLDPLVVSWGYESAAPSDSQFIDYHENQGTRDFSAFLSVSEAIAFMDIYDWVGVAARCRRMVKENAPRFAELLSSRPLAPLSDDFIGQMLSLPVQAKNPEAVQKELFERYKIEIPLMRQGDLVCIRYSINGFNEQADLDRLYEALDEMKRRGVIHATPPDVLPATF